MMKQEFERLAKIEVTDETYNTIIEPMYLATNLSKEDFIKTLNLKALAKPKTKPEKVIKKMNVRSRGGYRVTPNGCYYLIEYVEVVDVRIRDGVFVIKALTDDDLHDLAVAGHNLNLSTTYDFDYTECVDTKGRPIELKCW